MKLFDELKKMKRKKEKDWTLEERFMKRDRVIMVLANYDDNYAKNLPEETYERLITYVKEDMITMEEFGKKETVFTKRLKNALKKNPKTENDNKDKEAEEVSPKQMAEEENGEIIDMVEKIDKEEKQQTEVKPKNKKGKVDKEQQKQSDDNNDPETISSVLKDYLLSEKSLDGMAKGIKEKYLNIFDKSRDDIMDLYNSLCNTKCGQEILDEYSKSIKNCIDIMKTTGIETISKYVKSNRYLKARLNDIVSATNVAKNPKTENRSQVLIDSIIAIFIAHIVSLKIGSIIKDNKDNKDTNDDTILSIIKDKILNVKNEMDNAPDIAKEKLMYYMCDIESFISGVNKLKNNIKQNIEYDTGKSFIPEPEEELKHKKLKESIYFGDNWKRSAIFDYDKMNIDLNSNEHNNNITKKNAKDIKTIQAKLDDIIDKTKWEYNLELLINGTFELNATRNDTNNTYKYIIDTGALIGHGMYIYAGCNYISLEEKDIIFKLFNDPDKFVLTEDELKKCNSYLFNNTSLYHYIDMKGSGADKIKYLSNKDYIKLGDNLLNILDNIFYKKFNITCRFRFKSFTSINEFILVSDRYVNNNILNIEVNISPVPTTIAYKDNKVIVTYGNQTFSYNL